MTLIAFHGYSHNGAIMRGILEPLGLGAELVCPDGTVPANPEMVSRVAEALGQPVPPAPNLCWWDASEDGKVYRGWEESRAVVARLLEEHGPSGVLGFSQGAIFASAMVALSAAGELPPIRYAVFVAGRLPRTPELLRHYEKPIAIPSLHLMGARDLMTPAPLGDELAAKFVDPEIHKWNGPHVIPTRGPALAAIHDFIRRRGSPGT